MAGQIVFAALISFHPFAPTLPAGVLEVTSLDCGGGDAIFVVLPDRTTLLMDSCGRHTSGSRAAGSRWDPGENIVSPYLWSRGLERVDVVALTDSRPEHTDGLESIMRNFNVGEFWHGRNPPSDSYRELLDEARRQKIKIREVAAGDRFERGPASLAVLWPPIHNSPDPAGNATSGENSLVLRISSGAASVLLSGGISGNVADGLVLSGSHLESHTLGVALGDANYSSASGLLERVSPTVAVLTGAVRSRWPSFAPNTTGVFSLAGVRVYRTEVHGAVTVAMQGNSTSVRRYRASPGE